jgi:hypothetical protein
MGLEDFPYNYSNRRKIFCMCELGFWTCAFLLTESNGDRRLANVWFLASREYVPPPAVPGERCFTMGHGSKSSFRAFFGY